MVSCFITAALKRLDISAILLSKKERLKILRAANYLTKVKYIERDGQIHWIAAWFDGDTRAGARTVVDHTELIAQFPTVERQIRQLTLGGPSCYSFIGDKSAKIIPEAMTTTERTISLPATTQVVASGKRYQSNQRNGLTNKAYRELSRRREEESRHVQVEQVGLGLAQCHEISAIVTTVMPELLVAFLVMHMISRP